MARSREELIKGTLEDLRTQVDVWVATASRSGTPYLVPLSFYWTGEAMIVTTPRSSRTSRNFLDTGRARAAIGHRRKNVVVIDAHVEEMPVGEDVELGGGIRPRDRLRPAPRGTRATPSSASYRSGSRPGEATTPTNYATRT